MKKQRNQEGITLIALVITIIVLLILAGVSLRLVAGDEGILGRAEKAVDKNNTESLQEEIELGISELRIAYYNGEDVPAGVTSAGAYIKSKLEDGINTTQGKVTLDKDTENLSILGKDGENRVIGTYSTENGLSITGKDPSSGTTEDWEVSEDGTTEDWEVSEDGTTITAYKGPIPSNGKITIPSRVDGVEIAELRGAYHGYYNGKCYTIDGLIFFVGSEREADGQYYNTSLVEVNISKGVKVMGKGCFCSMKNLRTLRIPASVTTIENNIVWTGSEELLTVYYGGSKAQWNAIQMEEHHGLNKATVICKDGTIN